MANDRNIPAMNSHSRADSSGELPAGASLADAVAVTTLLVSGAVIGWPVLSGGYLTYLDNPAHVAEVYAAALEAHNGWSEIAFCGFPVTTLHSPAWYGTLSLLAKMGLPVGPFYALCVWLGFVAPAVALYAVARRALAPAPAAAIAYLLLIQRPAIVGIGSAFGGMWTFFLAAAGLILLVDRLARACVTVRDRAWIAALVGFVVVTHLYSVVPLALLALIHASSVLGTRPGGRGLLARQAVAGAVGLLAAAAYWVPLVMARDATVIVPQNLGAKMVAARLAIPTEVLDLINGQFPEFGLRLVLESVPMVALISAGVVGAAFMGRRRDDAPVYGALMAAVLLSLLLFVTTEFDFELLGPGSWRMVYFVRVGLALASIPLVARLWNAGGRRVYWRWVAAAAAASVVAWWFGGPLRAITPNPHGPEMAQVRELWTWLDRNRSDGWGRVYLQDTFEKPRPGVELSQSHVLALTAHHTGIRQLGATYGVAPYLTAMWTSSEFGTVYKRFVREQGDIDGVLDWMWASNATHIVTSDVRTQETLDLSEAFESLYHGGRFAVFRAVSIPNEWASVVAPGAGVVAAQFQSGQYRLDIRADRPGDVLVKSSYHPAWRLASVVQHQIAVDESGLIRLKDLPAGPSEVQISFHPAAWPGVLAAGTWVVILAGLIFGRRRRPE